MIEKMAWAVTILLKLFFAGLGMWWFARVLTGCGPRAAIVAGFAYMSCGFMTVPQSLTAR